MQIRTKLSLFVVLAGVVTAWSCGGKTPTEATAPQAAPPVAAAPGGEDDGQVEASAGKSFQRWYFADRCPDGKGIQMRIYTRTGAEKQVFPVNGGTFKAQSGRRVTKVIDCRTGQKVCPGIATLPESGRQWGVGINGTKPCTNCCRICSTKDVYVEAQCKGSTNTMILSLDGGLEAGASADEGLAFADDEGLASE
jgi:hypothetical protein